MVDGDDHDAPCLHLLDEGLGDARCTGGDDDAVERSVGGQPFITVAEEGLHPKRQLLDDALGLEIEVALPLDGEHLGAHSGQHTGLIARPRPDFEHLHPFLHLQQLGLEGDGVRLRDGLPRTDREGHVLIGQLDKRGVQEDMTWHLVDGRQHGLVGDAFRAQLLDELLAQAFVAVGVF